MDWIWGDERAMQPSDENRPIMNIIGEVVALGPLRRDLLPLVQGWFNDPLIHRTASTDAPVPLTIEIIETWYARSTTGEREINFIIYERATGIPIGTVGWRGIDYRNRTAEFSILIGNRASHGKGFGTETTRLMLDYGFTALGLHSAMLTTASFNRGGIRAYTKAGFREIGRRRECRLLNGTLWDTVYMEILASEFMRRAEGA